MSDRPASSLPPPAEQTLTKANNDVRVDFTAIFPLEVMIYMLEVGAFSHRQLAPLRLVNHTLRDAASDPSLYREYTCRSIGDLFGLPPFVANSLHRLSYYGSGDLDFEDLSDLMPNLTSLTADCCRFTSVDRSNLALRELSFEVDPGEGTGFLSQHTNLETLGVYILDWVPPIASLPLLRRLSLRYFEGDAGELLTALASAPCAATLEALFVEMEHNSEVLPGWWAPLADLSNLHEFGLEAPREFVKPGRDADGFASVLADHPTLAVLILELPEEVATAVFRHGLSPNLRVLELPSCVLGAEVEYPLVLLPTGLVALKLEHGRAFLAADVRALLSRCPQLRAMYLNLDIEAVAYLASGNVDRPLILGRFGLPKGADKDALTAAGHRVRYIGVGVHWRIAGGLRVDGEAVVY